MFEAKFTTADRMEQSRVTEGQAKYLDEHQALGAQCYVIVGFATENVYRVPWNVWKHMKVIYGAKYVKEAVLKNYKVPTARNGVLKILG